jgi:lipoic acid synthetase
MILGDLCTRDCAFCAVEHGDPDEPDRGEPRRVAAAARALGLGHVVVTSVTRDDLPDGGAAQFAATADALRREVPDAAIELLVPDFNGDEGAIERVLESRPDVLGHNVETVSRLYPSVRRGADYDRSLNVLKRSAASGLVAHVKSAMMLGIGETPEEVDQTLRDLRGVGVGIVCLGQYLRPSPAHHAVERFVPPSEFEEMRRRALDAGFDWVSSGPFVRSSYLADEACARGARAASR